MATEVKDKSTVERKRCEHRDKVFLYTLESGYLEEHTDVYRCLECQQIVNFTSTK